MKVARAPIRRFIYGALAFGVILLLERRRPLRPQHREPKLRRDLRNLTMAGMSAAAVSCCEALVLARLLDAVPQKRWGLLQKLKLPPPLRTVAAVALMDLTLFYWHYFTHRLPLLWRFHAVHHVDLDMDSSTALRFHFGEMMISLPYRALQIAAIGTDPGAFMFWQVFLSLSILFHHSNLRLPPRWERRVGAIVTTPRMHALHHADRPELGSCNWSSGLSVWDRLHHTLRWEQASPAIGVHGIERPAQVGLARLVAMPLDPPPEVVAYGHNAVFRARPMLIKHRPPK